MASLIPGARFIEYEGEDAYGWIDPPGMLDIEEFLTGRRSAPAHRPGPGHGAVHRHRGLDRTPLADRRRRAGATSSRTTTGSSAPACARWRGHEIKTNGDGFLATFDGPARAVSCAAEIVEDGRARSG